MSIDECGPVSSRNHEPNKTFDKVEKLDFENFRAEFECQEMKLEDW